MERFLVGEDKETWGAFIKAVSLSSIVCPVLSGPLSLSLCLSLSVVQLFETMGFNSFVRHTRVAPYRLCDYFDEV